VIHGEKDWSVNTSLELVGLRKDSNILWIGDTQKQFKSINVNDYRTKLGQEYDLVVFDCFSGFRANAAMALSGTIKANGVMIMLCPELSKWPSYPDPQQNNRTSFGYYTTGIKSQFFQYLTSAMQKDTFVAIVSQNAFSGALAYTSQFHNNDQFNDQNIAVQSICKVSTGHKNRPLVLTADRGRGKSSALGIAAAKLMQQSTKTIWLTAPKVSAVEQVFHHARRTLPSDISTKNKVEHSASSLLFMPIDKLLDTANTPDLLLVDEAASIPIHVLLKLVVKYPRIVLSATMHGYEGSGRGFEIRFKQQLAIIKPEYKHLHLTRPIRWLEGDSLESFWFRIFNNRATPLPELNMECNVGVSCRNVSQQELVNNPLLAASIFNLLVAAHYQTSPDDFQRLLDAPESQCFVLFKHEIPIGVAQIIEEGGRQLKPIANEVASNQRRVKGHLVAQNLASSYYLTEFCLCTQWRISRIAIHPTIQRNGFGSSLLNYIEQEAKNKNVELITAAFGINPDTLAFWDKQYYLPAKLSLKQEISSGEYSHICIKPLSINAKKLSSLITEEFFANFLFNIDKELRLLHPDVVLSLLSNFVHLPLIDSNIIIIKQFMSGIRNVSGTKRILKQGVLEKIKAIKQLDNRDRHFIVAYLLQSHSNKELSGRFELTGKKQIENKTRIVFKKLYHEQT
jgi:tRNA(Met) cytidine acetyltransferase